MAIKLKFEVNTGTNSADIKVVRKSNTPGPDYNRGIVELTVGGPGYLVGLKSDNATVIAGADDFNHGSTPLRLNTITKVRITCDFNQAEQLARLVRLREKLKLI